MSKPNYTHLTLVVDASGSMRKYQYRIERALVALMEAQKATEGILTVSLNFFSGRSRHWHFLSPQEAIDTLATSYSTGGSTALFDAVGESAHYVADKIVRLRDDEQPEKIIFAIITDGEESGASVSYTESDVKQIVDFHEETYSWEFLYIGANQDAYKRGKAFGIKAGKALSYATAQSDSIERAVEAVSSAITRYRQNGAPHANQFFDAEDHAYQQALGAAAAPLSS